MTILESIPEAQWTEKGGVLWMDCENASAREIAKAMRDVGARFVTITARKLPSSPGFRLEYHWDLEGRLLGFAFEIPGNAIDSIHDLCEAADWIEREIHEGFAIDFTGRVHEPLQLRKGEELGVTLPDSSSPSKPSGKQEVTR